MNGWILLHKKIWDNPRFYKNPHALTVWVWLLTHCNQNGVVTCGRKQIAGECGVGESNVYRILKSFEVSYFENEPLVNSQTNNRFSVITILKYKELQRKANNEMNNNVTTIEQQSNNNITLIKNKEERIKNSKETLEAKEVYEHYIKVSNKNPNTYKFTTERKEKVCARLRDIGKDRLLLAITNAHADDFFLSGRTWGNLDYLVRKYENAEKYANLSEGVKNEW
jgi:hypothetical protein